MLIWALDPKFNDPVRGRKQGMVGADTDVDAGAIHGATLPNQDVAGKYILATELLDAQALRM
jgi:hypothetical protein